MIKPKHPLEFYNIHQEIFLKHFFEKDREYHTLRFSYQNAVYLYYRMQLIVSPYDYRQWLNGIANEQYRNIMKEKGFKACEKNFSFIRFLKKKRKITEEEYIIEKMGIQKYARYKNLCQYYIGK